MTNLCVLYVDVKYCCQDFVGVLLGLVYEDMPNQRINALYLTTDQELFLCLVR